jgi:hypothetical protein
MSEKVQAKANSTQTVKAAGSILQRKCACGQHTVAGGECESCEKKRLQRRAAGRSEVDEAPLVVHEVLRSSGQPLDPRTRSLMEPRFGHDFSRVRVHTDAKAAESAQSVNALAFTVGHDLVFATGEYNPQSSDGMRLLAHELAHVVQQREVGHDAGVQHRLRVGDEDDAAEREADAMAERSLSSTATPPVADGQSSVNASQLARVSAPVVRRRVSDKFGTIKKNLTYRFLDWAITEKEAHQVLQILKGLPDEDLKDTVAEMEKEGLVDRLFDNLSKEDIQGNQDELRRIKNNRVYKETKKVDGKEVTTTTTGSCSPVQNREISTAVKAALEWLDKGIAQLDAFLAKPSDAASQAASNALSTYFKSTTPDVAKYVRGQLSRLQADLRNVKIYSFECHGDWDLTCGSSGAYVPGSDRERVVYCDSFFEGGDSASNSQVEGLLHELAHAQVGGTHIIDRAYSSNRMLKQLSTEEALTNAESYGLLIQQLGTGKTPWTAATKDTFEDCPDEWKPLLDRALARAQRWNRDTQVSIAKLTPEKAAKYGKDDIAQIGGTTQKDIDEIRDAVNKLADELDSPVDFECEPKGGGRCEGADTYWYAVGDFHICPSWTKLSADIQVVSLLAGLYGYKAGVSGKERRRNYALFAQSRTKSAAPALGQILGSSAWTPAQIRIVFRPEKPVPGPSYYVESGTSTDRMSEDLPEYSVPPCHTGTLPFSAAVDFYVDRDNKTRPAPFTPPAVSVEFNYMTPSGPLKQAVSDPRADYYDFGYPLDIKFPRKFNFTLKKNGPLQMKFELKDPDTGVNRVYDDTIDVVTQSLCDIPSKPPDKQVPGKLPETYPRKPPEKHYA